MWISQYGSFSAQLARLTTSQHPPPPPHTESANCTYYSYMYLSLEHVGERDEITPLGRCAGIS